MNVLLKIFLFVNDRMNKIRLKCLYGNKFKYNDLSIRGKLRVYIEESGVCNIGSAFFNNDCSINCHTKIQIGNNCIFGENVKLYDHNHIYKSDSIPISKQGYSCEPIIIGNNVWIGSNCVILKGVKIGDHVVIGANCVIYKDIPSNTVVKNKQAVLLDNIHAD